MTRSRGTVDLLRRARRSTTALTGASLVAVASLAALLVRVPAAPGEEPTPPVEMPLVRSDLVCAPATEPGAVVSLSGAPGVLERWRPGREPTELSVPALGATPLPPSGRTTVLSARDVLAPGLAAGAASEGRRGLTASPCVAPTEDSWFVGVGASSEYATTLRLVNPDTGPATVDVTFWSDGGEVVVPGLRGLRVPGRSEQVHELADVVPRRGALAMRVQVSRGRAAALVSTTVDPIGGGRARTEWVRASSGPSTTGRLLGLSSGADAHRLQLLNPAEDEARVRVRVVTGSSTFAPVGLDEVRVAAGAMVELDLGRPLRRALRDGALGLLVESGTPVVAGLASDLDGELAIQVAAEPLDGPGVAVLPAGRTRQVLLAGPESRTPVQLEFRDAKGRGVASRRIAVEPGSGTTVKVPRGADLVVVDGGSDSLVARILVEGPDGATVVDVVSPPVSAWAPSVSRKRVADR